MIEFVVFALVGEGAVVIIRSFLKVIFFLENLTKAESRDLLFVFLVFSFFCCQIDFLLDRTDWKNPVDLRVLDFGDEGFMKGAVSFYLANISILVENGELLSQFAIMGYECMNLGHNGLCAFISRNS